jgi:hypothetical protein
MNVLVLPDTAQNQRKEKASDERGIPTAFGRAVAALRGPCAHCSERAVISDGQGVGLCEHHRRERNTRRADGLRERERLRRMIDVARREMD